MTALDALILIPFCVLLAVGFWAVGEWYYSARDRRAKVLK